jgi:hypothetical protein
MNFLDGLKVPAKQFRTALGGVHRGGAGAAVLNVQGVVQILPPADPSRPIVCIPIDHICFIPVPTFYASPLVSRRTSLQGTNHPDSSRHDSRVHEEHAMFMGWRSQQIYVLIAD